MSRYLPERKEAVLSKVLPPYNLTVAELARQEGISPATLYNWRKQAKSEGAPTSALKPTRILRGLTLFVRWLRRYRK